MKYRFLLAMTAALFAASPLSAHRPDVLTAAGPGDAPEISRSRGVEGGVVVLWPRIIPAETASESWAIATAVQQRLRSMVARALPGTPVDVRPAPERVCPMSGCQAMTVGALVLRDENGCAVLALVSGPGKSHTRVLPWAGHVRIRNSQVPFREPPENWVTVTDFAPCHLVLDELSENDSEVARAIQSMGR